LLILFDLIINRQNLLRKAAYLVGLVTFYLLLNKVFEVPSYGVLFKHTFLSPVLYPVSNSESFHLSEYIVFKKTNNRHFINFNDFGYSYALFGIPIKREN
jgi:hypothetical protein